MSKKNQLSIRIDQELYQAIQDVAQAEQMSKTELILPVLRGAFLPDGERIFRIRPSVAIPLVGEIVNDNDLGNVVVVYGGEA
jgi:hypothetical protein